MYDVAFHPTINVVATAAGDEVRFWWLQNQSRLYADKVFKHPSIDAVRFSEDGKMFFTGSDDGLVKGWETPRF